MGQRAIPNTELFLDDVFVSFDRRLGEEGQGFAGLMHTFDRSRVMLAASATGLARAALEYAVDYAKQRIQFGKPIAEHQSVAFRLADMALRVDASRLLTWRAASLLDAGARATTEAAMAKLHASETAMWCTWAAVQTLGGWGYSREYPSGRQALSSNPRAALLPRGRPARHPASPNGGPPPSRPAGSCVRA
jgi:alkylation response protein AidB-like acyl-CoA dehydrogenase